MADQTRRHIAKPCFHLAARPFLAQHDGTVLVESNDMERILADIDADKKALPEALLYDDGDEV